MHIFGENWQNHERKLKDNWLKIVGDNDTVIIPGDLSWALTLDEAILDFKFIDKLPGKKIISKGNHDYFWSTAKKIKDFFRDNNIKTIDLLHNNAFLIENKVICGTKGYLFDQSESKEQNNKLMLREAARLEMSIKEGLKFDCPDIRVFLHYPPVFKGESEQIMDILIKYNIKYCYFGHIHGSGISGAIQGDYKGVMLKMISADYLNFTPIPIN